MQADVKRSAEVGVQRIRADQRVHEPCRSPHRPGVDQEAGRVAASSVSATTTGPPVNHVDEHVFGELDAEHRRRGQGREESAPSELTRLHTTSRRLGGTASPLGSGWFRRVPPVSSRPTRPMPDQLRCVERVTGGLHPRRGGNAARLDIVGHRRGDGYRSASARVVETGQLQVTVLAPFEIGERAAREIASGACSPDSRLLTTTRTGASASACVR